jgi:hypothetical protein
MSSTVEPADMDLPIAIAEPRGADLLDTRFQIGLSGPV